METNKKNPLTYCVKCKKELPGNLAGLCPDCYKEIFDNSRYRCSRCGAISIGQIECPLCCIPLGKK